ncbi:MAG: hypothetical protein F6K30_25600 [Cyanothece sp. SIO2G6]|nr:hypothetical protein [Cyanothece sp. SIO2G6]
MSDLGIGEGQPHQIEAPDPDSKRLAASTYCYLLVAAEKRDEKTWA